MDEHDVLKDGFNASHFAINTTVRCQHRCVYCFEGERTTGYDVPVVECKRILDEASENVGRVIFMGAEPLMNPDIVELIRYASEDKGLTAGVSTNALRFASKRLLDRCIEAGLAYVEMSCPAPDAETYAALTQTKPRGYTVLMRALDNLREAALSDRTSPDFSINVVIVVSSFNVERLDELVGILKEKLEGAPYQLTFRSLQLTPTKERYIGDHVAVPLRQIRNAFERLDLSKVGLERVVFRNFPLCAIPGYEHRDANLWDECQGHDVRCNFQQRTLYTEMRYRFQRSPYRWLCNHCAFDPVCLSRAVLAYDDSGETVALDERFVSYAPIPWHGAFPEALSKLTGHDGDEEGRAQPDPEHWRGSWAAAPARFRPAEDDDTREEKPALAALRELVNDLREQGVLGNRPLLSIAGSNEGHYDLVLKTQNPSSRLRVSADAKGELLLVDASARDDNLLSLPPLLRTATNRVSEAWAWERLLDGALPSMSLAKSWNDASPHHPFPLANLLLASNNDGELVTVASCGPVRGVLQPGFLCAGRRLHVHSTLLDTHEGRQLIERLAEALRDGMPSARNDVDFPTRLWGVYGKALLPRGGSQASVADGLVSLSDIRLFVRARSGETLAMGFEPAESTSQRIRARGRGVGLYVLAHGGKDFPQTLRRTLQAYSARIGGSSQAPRYEDEA